MWMGVVAAELVPCSSGWSVGSLLCICVWRPSPCALSWEEKYTECGQPELAGWVMNLLLRHSVKHNYTHRSLEVLSCSMWAKTKPLETLGNSPFHYIVLKTDWSINWYVTLTTQNRVYIQNNPWEFCLRTQIKVFLFLVFINQTSRHCHHFTFWPFVR